MLQTRKIELWLYFCCFMVFALAVIGAITRLTESGLSIVEWHPLMGALPPMNETEWQHVYELYQQSPEFQHKHNWMELADFKRIFFWEWLHRLLGRAIGLVYALPLLWFMIRKQIPEGYKWKLAGVFILGGGQGVLGWYMVQSGLVDQPEVSHFRLAAHLGLALLIFSLMWWVALELKWERYPSPYHYKRGALLKTHGVIALLFLAATIIWGAFVAGMDAGKIYNSFPLMDGGWLPPEEYSSAGILQQAGWVQFSHRWLGVATFLIVFSFARRTKSNALAAMVVIQVGLGIATLLSHVLIPLAALHQAGAIVLLALLLLILHRIMKI